MAQQKQGGGREQPSKGSSQSQRKPNLDQGADAMSQRPGAASQKQHKPNLSQGADAMSQAGDTGSQGDRGTEGSRDKGSRSR